MSDDLQELQQVGGLNVWAEKHEVIERQALEHLEALKAQTNQPPDEIEEGELSKDGSSSDSAPQTATAVKPVSSILDLDHYFKSQQQMKVIKKKPKHENVSEHSLAVAQEISKNQRLKKRKTPGNKNLVPKKSEGIESVGLCDSDAELTNIYTTTQSEAYETDASTCGGSKLKRKRDEVSYSCEQLDSENESLQTQSIDSGSEYIPSEAEDDEPCNPKPSRNRRISTDTNTKCKKIFIEKVKDDGDIKIYENRLKMLHAKERKKQQKLIEDEDDELSDDSEIYPDKKLPYGFTIPGNVWHKLFKYQKTGVKWLCELNEYKKGGLLGDEMGLGKTVQLIGLFAALDYSKKNSKFGHYHGLGPCLIICPATVLHQWVRHFHLWWPYLRVAVLHQSGSYPGKKKTKLIYEINKKNGILITTYNSVLQNINTITEQQWHYLVLDEGHKIRNPEAKVSKAVKKIKTPHRIIMTGSPMQNNLSELWSLFDFITPGKLGTLPIFLDHFATPIVQGGYANASPIQEATALTIATALKNIISPFILRRAKVDVNTSIDLPNKNEQVLFCEMTAEQIDLYKGYLMGEHVTSILDKSRYDRLSGNQERARMLVALTTLRKICNHPDLYLGDAEENVKEASEDTPEELRFGYYKQAGKMKVVAALLAIWKRQGHRVLLFTQTRAMIGIFEKFLTSHKYSYLKMDGTTNIGSRQPLIDQFNQNEHFFVFLLTTRVGGLGVNLTGANRIIIYDPDWNPATDMQARERAWRIGQQKEVTVYRLLSAGTIEEKMYQRQIWKQLLSNKVLLDPNQKRFFKTTDLQELFSLQEPMKGGNTETSNIFQHSKVERPVKETAENVFSKDKIEAMKMLAQKLSKQISATSNPLNVNEKTDQTEPAKNFMWDPSTVRFKKPRKIILPKEPPEINLVDDQVTDIPFTDLISSLDVTVMKQTKFQSISDDCSTSLKSSQIPQPIYTTLAETDTTPPESQTLSVNTENIPTSRASNDNEINETAPNNIKQKHKHSKRNKEREGGSDDVKHRKRRKKYKHSNDRAVDGEIVDGLVKTEKAKITKELPLKTLNERQDDYVLNQLFSKGVHTALQHEVIVQSGYEDKDSIKVKTEADYKAKLALKALRSSRLKKWRW